MPFATPPARPVAGPRRACLACAALVAALGVAAPASAGGGPENVLLVVNDLSDDSKTIANHYIRWRNLPASNVLHVTWRGSQQDCSVERFRNDLLKPIVETIDRRRLGAQIDYVVYSAGFPWVVDLRKDYPDQEFRPEMKPVASLTGATYLWQYVLQKNPAIVAPGVNWYVPKAPGNNLLACRDAARVPSRAFRLRYLWAPDGSQTTDKSRGQRYLLSTMLGVTAGRGNTVDEVLAYLQNAVLADRTSPEGTFYFAKNSNVRSKTRHDCYAGVVAALRQAGARAEIVPGDAPRGRSDILGLTVGAEFSDLAAARSRVVPGAICEHLTSFGGDLRAKGYQMPLTDFLRNGAAGASGTVTEPRAIQTKFPLPSIHLHYRRGCSLAEAFYQSVAGPYQLLIVGDPLCQPWADPPGLRLEGIEPGQTVRGTVAVKVEVGSKTLAKPRPCELFVDGRLRARAPSGTTINFDTTQLAEGWHELRFVAAGADAIEAQTAEIVPLEVDNDPEASLDLQVSPLPVAGRDDWVELVATSTGGGETIVFSQGERELGRVKPVAGDGGQASARLRVRASKLGGGPTRLRAHAAGDGPRARPVWLVVR